MSDERARDEETAKGARRAGDGAPAAPPRRPEAEPERGLGLGREGHGGVLLPDRHGGRGERGERGRRTERRAGREREPYGDEDGPEETPDR
ncbi:hypothetical protein [Streptomyces synnematoformans]|uniref:Uncharacterized protein n=1 Tax=Streptomyces synnematoformans TaxID=415721 RepID=A0ABN2Z6L3_9ACTN